jgi:two-component system sensor histidine kinase DegS
MPGETAPQPPATLADILARLDGDVAGLERELGEVDLLVAQAKAEAARHEGRRAQAVEKVGSLAGSGDADPKELFDLNTQLLTLTKRAALMESQVDVLEGKRRALGRYRDAVVGYASSLREVDPDAGPVDADAPLPPALSKIILNAQEDLRREIARAMHDGPAQSLTNIVLQAQIVERLVTKDPELAQGEVRQLVAMVQQTLDATKSFIFDVRPMVLDDLGLVPTLRRAARDRGRRAGIPVEFDSLGQDQRLPMDLESGLFRILDEALAAYLAAGPERVTLKMDWGERIEGRVAAVAVGGGAAADGPSYSTSSRAAPDIGRRSSRGAKAIDEELPPALAAMIEDRRADERDAAEAARRGAIVTLPSSTWREIQQRASTIGVTAELIGEGSELRIVADLPATDGMSRPA